MHHNSYQPQHTSVLGSLRAVIPTHDRVTFTEALRVAELRANKLLELHGVSDGPVPTEIISELPKLSVEYTGRLVSGATFWDQNRQVWVIHISRADSPARRRFTLAHEYKHIIDHGRQSVLYRGTGKRPAALQAEQAADYFAGCLLVPRRLLKRAWGNGIQDTSQLAEIFRVSEQAIGVRLRQTGLVDARFRHRPVLPHIVDAGPPPGDDLPEEAAAEEGALSA